MTYALAEVEAVAKKAARGAGYSWGMAEEAAMAARWLCAAGLDGCAALSALLIHVDGSELTGMAPSSLGGDWEAQHGKMCPLTAGAALSDSTVYWAEGGKLITNVIAPIMLLPFAANSARQLGTIVTVEWNGTHTATDGSVVSIERDEKALIATLGHVVIRTGGSLDHPLPPQQRATPNDNDWTALNRFASRTYAPETEESRLRGAGAGLTDND